MKEEWKIIKEYPDYKISNKGRVMSLDRGNILCVWTSANGYKSHRLEIRNATGKLLRADLIETHTLVAKYFVKNPNPKKYTILRHISSNKMDAEYTNLEWVDENGNPSDSNPSIRTNNGSK